MSDRDDERLRAVVRKPEPLGGASLGLGKPWDPARGMWVDVVPNRERRRGMLHQVRGSSGSNRGSRDQHARRFTDNGAGLGVTRAASSSRLSTEEVIRHRNRDPDAVRRARFGEEN